MAGSGIAKIFKHGRSQAVRLPLEFRMPGDRVRVRREGNAIVLEPIEVSTKELFAKLDEYLDVPFMENGREQPPTPPDDDVDSFD